MRFSRLSVPAVACVAAFMGLSPAVANDTEICLKGSGEEKIAACTRAIDSGRLQGHELAASYMNRGIAYREKEDLGPAIADLEEAVRLDPVFADAYRNRGIAYRYKGELDRAIADYTEAIRLDPKFAPAFNARGVAYNAKGEFDRAVADLSD